MSIVSTVADQAYSIVKQRILLRQALPGTKLQEMDLAEELGVSRTPLREAIARLAKEGLVTVEPRRGAYVTLLTFEDVEEILEVREALECQAARAAARKASRDDIDGLRQLLLQRREQIAGHPDAPEAPDFDFHDAIVRLSRNSRLVEQMNQIHNQLSILRLGSSFVKGRPDLALDEHSVVIDAIASGDPDCAEASMRAHLQKARHNILGSVILRPEGAA